MSRNPLAGAAAAALVLGAAALSSPATADVRVFACEPEWAALANAIGGDDVIVHSATHGGQDAHHVRARPSLIAKVRRADVLFCSGAELESGWLPVLMQRGARHVVQPGQPGHIMAADHVPILDRPDNIDRSLGDIHPSGNPHVHLDPRNVATLASELSRRLERIDPDNAEAYRSRLVSFRAGWAEALEGWSERAARLRGMEGHRVSRGMGVLPPLGRTDPGRGPGGASGDPAVGGPPQGRAGAGPGSGRRGDPACALRAARLIGLALRADRDPGRRASLHGRRGTPKRTTSSHSSTSP